MQNMATYRSRGQQIMEMALKVKSSSQQLRKLFVYFAASYIKYYDHVLYFWFC